jgi:hypothetical protein
VVQSGDQVNGGSGVRFIGKWAGLLGLLAVLFIGDQIRINRPGHKYRLTVEVTTPDGSKTASGVMAVVPDRGYSRGGHTVTQGDAIFDDLGQGKNLVVLLAHQDLAHVTLADQGKTLQGKTLEGKTLDLDDINYVALRAYAAARGSRISFNEMSRQTGAVPVQGALIPVLVSFGDPNDPATARMVDPDHAEAVLGDGYRLGGLSAEVLPNGFWPVDFGGVLGEPVTRGISVKLPWLSGTGDPAATALRAAGLATAAPVDAREAFRRK